MEVPPLSNPLFSLDPPFSALSSSGRRFRLRVGVQPALAFLMIRKKRTPGVGERSTLPASVLPSGNRLLEMCRSIAAGRQPSNHPAISRAPSDERIKACRRDWHPKLSARFSLVLKSCVPSRDRRGASRSWPSFLLGGNEAGSPPHHASRLAHHALHQAPLTPRARLADSQTGMGSIW